jgi:exopolysaccharide production protein ExoQ
MTQANPRGVQDSDVFIDLRRRRADAAAAAGGPVRDVEFQTVNPGRRRTRRSKPIWFDLNAISLDGGYAFLLVAAMLFVQQAGAASGVVMAVLPLIYMVLRRRLAGEILVTRWPLFLVPLFALMSVAWSEAPGVSAKYAAEMWLTAAAGIGLSAARRPTAVLKGVCLAFAVYCTASMGLGHSVGVGVGGGGEAFAGLGDGKNLAADIASTGALISLATLFISMRQKSLLWWLVAACAVAIEIYLMFLARSAGAMLALGGGVAALLALVSLSAMSRAVRIGAVTLVLLSAGILVASVRNVGAALITFSTQMFDKDPTLTGRTYLWYRAQDLIAEKPLLGHGFYAFWRQGNMDAEGLWQYAGIAGRAGFNFHNSLVELTVQMGMAGAAVFCLVGLIGLLSLVRQFLERPTLPVCFWLTYMVYVAIRAPMEAVGYAPFYFSTCLLFAAAGSGLERLPRRVRAGQAYVPQRMRLQHFYAAGQARAATAAYARTPAE